MPQIFHPSFNTISRVALVGLILLVIALGWGWTLFTRSDYAERVHFPREQPVQFSHQHHVQRIGIDCRYCHTTVETSSFANIPPVHTCMTCHSQIWADSPMLEPVRRSYATKQPIHWKRVYDLPDFVYFDHSIHVNKGIGCTSCHGQIDRMPLTWVNQQLHMKWCLDCHLHPELQIRPQSEVFSMVWEAPTNQNELGMALVNEYQVKSRTDCSYCHR